MADAALRDRLRRVEAGYTRTVSVSGNYTVLPVDDVVLLAVGASGSTATLPTTRRGKELKIKKSTSSIKTLTVTRSGTATIDGATSVLLTAAWQSLSLVSDGTDWFTL